MNKISPNAKPLLRPELQLDWLRPSPSLLRSMASGLNNLHGAAPGDILGVALGHGVGPHYRDGSVSEYKCAFVSTGDDRTCDGTIAKLKPGGRAVINSLIKRWLSGGKLARLFHEDFGKPEGEFETLHFRDFTAVIFNWNAPGAPDIRLFVEPAETLAEADRRIAEICAIFRFLGEWNDLLNCYRYELPRPEMLLRA